MVASTTVTSFGGDDPVDSPSEKNQAFLQNDARRAEECVPCTREESPVCLAAANMSIATGQPSLVNMSSGSTHIPVWSLSGGTAGQSVAGLVSGLPSGCEAVKVEIVVTTTDASTSPDYEDVYRCHLSQMVEDAPFTAPYVQGTPVRTALSADRFTPGRSFWIPTTK